MLQPLRGFTQHQVQVSMGPGGLVIVRPHLLLPLENHHPALLEGLHHMHCYSGFRVNPKDTCGSRMHNCCHLIICLLKHVHSSMEHVSQGVTSLCTAEGSTVPLVASPTWSCLGGTHTPSLVHLGSSASRSPVRPRWMRSQMALGVCRADARRMYRCKAGAQHTYRCRAGVLHTDRCTHHWLFQPALNRTSTDERVIGVQCNPSRP